ncbi:hypothetical protein GCK72_007590 [Caenorhabditis remanei]|uniref:Uncharacterized protein n=1 Tax=Caenorhabditis remanei TaxID=31234 RepID=A0A6A5HKH9_CAERE|nr:hypothetical protein GCK72_007590 [Caenorhabditis remanei]KAF1767631.1 hypothetical protein GCK72_007590 [Caenorhabditis remanei]
MAFSGSGRPPQSKDQVHNELIKILKSGSEEQKKAIKEEVDYICKYFPHSEDYKSGDKNKSSYKLCCETVDYCSFYHQSWFFMLCTVVACLITITVMIATVICLIRRRNKDIGIGGYKEREEQYVVAALEELEKVDGGAKPMKTGKTSTGEEGKRTTGGLLSSGNSYL